MCHFKQGDPDSIYYWFLDRCFIFGRHAYSFHTARKRLYRSQDLSGFFI